ncbi:hypothetical protein E7744_15270 (plasmid) [Citricoccus sp. SGAir0253]|uniref:hypothetical protein n=1 Tax=Citricoccus sp. SGAir0253 TaxID=2567881 RepID=UPI0010CCFD87|nr:hypothetical protein [Citricoccus sp. SGAir0253]QCU79678.1 hypothetical protein E7744_15270 [Citricoccus sp. SGAir0253]
MYAPIDLQTPLVTQWVGTLLAIAGLAVLAHGWWRRKRYQAHWDDEDARYAGPGRMKDAVREVIAGAGVLVIGLGAIGYSIYGDITSQNNIQENVATKYGAESVEDKGWRGNALRADVTMPDGTVHQDVLIIFEDSGEPQIKRDLTGSATG